MDSEIVGDVMELLPELTALVGDRHVLTGPDVDRYGADFLGKYIARPIAVVRPADVHEVSAVLNLANRTGTPIVPISGNTGLVGGSYAPNSVMVSLERLNKIRAIRETSRIAIVESGVVLSQLHDAAGEHGLAFPLFFGARGSAMIGGNLATNAGGSNVLRYGSTRGLTLGIEVVLADGRILDLMSELHKDNTGYDLKQLFIGSEGTLGIITAAVVKLVPKPNAYATAMVAVPTLSAALETLNHLKDATGGLVEGFEFMPRTYMERLKIVRPDLKPPLGHDRDITILVELGATSPRDSQAGPDGTVPIVDLLETTLAAMIERGLADDATIARSEAQRLEMWKIREVAAEITHGRKPMVDTDIAVPLDKVDEFMHRVLDQVSRIDPEADTITVSHLGDGNVHFTVWPSRTDEETQASLRDMIDRTAAKLGGSFSAEHGIGLSKRSSMAELKNEVAVDVMRSLKATLDPNNILNPGKVIP